jgi:hypothetical protein
MKLVPVLVLSLGAAASGPMLLHETPTPMLKRITPLLVVDAIEPELPFWKRLGLEVQVEVPEGERIGFAILSKDEVELMLQTRASIANDVPAALPLFENATSSLYIEVDSLDEVIGRLDGVPVLVPRRSMSYGADEIVVRSPSGHVVGLAQHAKKDG